MEQYQIEQLNKTKVFVEATSYEYLSLWRKNRDREKKQWDEESMGWGVTVGEMQHEDKSFPVFISLRFATIDNTYICFIDCTSIVVNWNMVNDWVKKVNPNAKTTDSMNFHNAF